MIDVIILNSNIINNILVSIFHKLKTKHKKEIVQYVICINNNNNNINI